MIRLRSAAALLAAFILLFSASPASFAEDSVPEIEEIVLDDGTGAVSAETETDAEEEVFTPSHGSPYQEGQGSAYWNTPMDITDEDAVWQMLMEPITVPRRLNLPPVMLVPPITTARMASISKFNPALLESFDMMRLE